jgi:hypothetical protein
VSKVDFVKNFNAGAGGGDDSAARQQQGTDGAASSAGQGEGGGLMGKLNELGGGGQRGEANEDYLDKVCCGRIVARMVTRGPLFPLLASLEASALKSPPGFGR